MMYSRHAHRQLRALALLLASTIIVVIVSLFLTMSARTVSAASPHVDVMVLNTDTSPASLRFLTRTMATAESDGAQALVIAVDTPGGNLGSMKSMTEAE